MMQYKVPQDVLRADKIVGFLTLRQLIIVMIGGIITYGLYTVLSKQYFIEIWLAPVLFVGLITMAFAFIRFHEIAFEKLVLFFIEYKFRPRARTWQKMRGDCVLSVLSTAQQKAPSLKAQSTMSSEDRRKKLKEISSVVDTHSKDLSKTISPK